MGWQLDFELLKRPLPNSVAMNPLTAFCFLLGATALVIPENRSAIRFVQWALFVIASIMFVSFSGVLVLPIDRILFSEKLILDASNGISNSMAPNTAFCFLLVSASWLLRRHRKPVWIAELLVLSTMTLGLLSLIGYSSQVPEFYGSLSRFPMALHTAVAFVILGTGLLLQRPYGPFMSTLLNPYSGGLVARILVPLAIGLPILLGAIRLYGERQGFFSSTYGLMLNVCAIILLFCIVIWRVASIINEKDSQQTKTEMALEELNRELEERVAQRTAEAIRQRQKAEYAAEQLGVREQRFRALVENAGDAVLVIDANMKPTYVSSSIERIFRIYNQRSGGAGNSCPHSS